MPVFDGQPVNAAVTNPAFLDAQVDDTAFGKITLDNADVISGATIPNIQRAINNLMTTAGTTPTTDGTTYTSTQRITNGQNHVQAISSLDTGFNGTTGHVHSGATGDAPPIPSTNVTGNPLLGYFQQSSNIFGVTGGSWDVTAFITDLTPSTGPTVEGIVVDPPYNKLFIRQATGPDQGDSFVDGFGNVVYGRITWAAGPVWTITFYVDIAGTETAYSFPGSVDLVFYYQKLYNPIVDAPVYSTLAFIPSDNVTSDVLVATTAIYGKVILASAAAQSVGSSNSAGTANATVANADHVHQGVHAVNTDGSTNIYGDVQFVGAGGVVTSQLGQIITITAAALASTTPADVGSVGAIGVGTTAARADHVHRGVHAVNTDGSTNIYGDIQIVGAGGSVATQLLQVITITSPSFGASAQQVGDTGSGGAAATMSRSDHVHQGVSSFAKTLGTLRYGNISLTEGTNITITDNTDGTFTIASTPAGITQLTGDVTAGPGSGSQVATIAANAVTNSKLAQMPAHTFKGNNTASTADPIDLTQAQLTAEINTFTTTLNGSVPAPGTVLNYFLRDDGTWQPASGGGSGAFVTSSQTALTGGGTITISLTDGAQSIRVQGSGAAVTLSNTPFGTSAPLDGGVYILVGNSNTNTVTLVNNDAAKGCILNGTVTLGKYDSIYLEYRSDFDRFFEVSRSM